MELPIRKPSMSPRVSMALPPGAPGGAGRWGTQRHPYPLPRPAPPPPLPPADVCTCEGCQGMPLNGRRNHCARTALALRRGPTGIDPQLAGWAFPAFTSRCTSPRGSEPCSQALPPHNHASLPESTTARGPAHPQLRPFTAPSPPACVPVPVPAGGAVPAGHGRQQLRCLWGQRRAGVAEQPEGGVSGGSHSSLQVSEAAGWQTGGGPAGLARPGTPGAAAGCAGEGARGASMCRGGTSQCGVDVPPDHHQATARNGNPPSTRAQSADCWSHLKIRGAPTDDTDTAVAPSLLLRPPPPVSDAPRCPPAAAAPCPSPCCTVYMPQQPCTSL